MLVRGRERILFTSSQVKLGWTQNSFITSVGFTLTLDKIHGTRGEFAVKLTSEKVLKRGQFSLTMEDSILTGLLGTRPKILSISSKTLKIRVSKLEKLDTLRLDSKWIIFANFARLYLLCYNAWIVWNLVAKVIHEKSILNWTNARLE